MQNESSEPSESADPETRRIFRSRLRFLPFVFFCLPVSAYIAQFFFRFENHHDLVGLAASFFLALLYSFYCCSKVIDLVMRGRFGDVEIADQALRNRAVKAKVQAAKEKRQHDRYFAREAYVRRLFSITIVPCMAVSGALGGVTGLFFGAPFATRAELGAPIGIVVAGPAAIILASITFSGG